MDLAQLSHYKTHAGSAVDTEPQSDPSNGCVLAWLRTGIPGKGSATVKIFLVSIINTAAVPLSLVIPKRHYVVAANDNTLVST